MKRSLAAAFALVLLVAGSAWAHHNMSAVFDVNQRFTVTGTLMKLDWRNPHIFLSVDVTSDQGQVETWLFEGQNPGAFRAKAIGKSDFVNSIDKTITVEASRARDGSLLGLIRQITLADGTVVSACPQYC